jgi:ribosomal protein S18 acetylase RimI-like enzyme
MSSAAFARDRYHLTLARAGTLVLEPPEAGSADIVAQAMCRMDPWLTLASRPERILGFLLQDDASCHRWIVRCGGEIAGVVAVRFPWLHGPYLNLLAALPRHQGAGIGSAILGWMERETGDAGRNLWLCASEFNARAIAFYERHGFARVGLLPDLAAPGFAEVLMRKRLDGADGAGD